MFEAIETVDARTAERPSRPLPRATNRATGPAANVAADAATERAADVAAGRATDPADVAGDGVGEHLASLVACAAVVAADARAAAAWSGSDRVAALASLEASVAAIAEARAHLLVADRESGDSQLPGDRSFEAARARVTRAGVGEARRQVQQADALVSMGTVAVGVRDGLVPLGHLDVLARVAASASPEVAAVLRSVEVQEDVVRLARIQSAPDFAKALARFVAAHDPAGLEAVHQDSYRERFLVLSAQPHGVFVKGRLDVTAAESLRVALAAMGQFPDESRTPGQAYADALVMLAERACAGTSAPGASTPQTSAGTTTTGSRTDSPGAHTVTTGTAATHAGAAATRVGTATTSARPGASLDADTADLPDGGGSEPDGAPASGTGSRPHLSLLVPAETFAELLAHEQARQTAARDRAGAGAGPGGGRGRDTARVAPDWSPVAPATLEDGTPVAMSELARCLCEADITRIVMAADGQPLDVGRTRRLHTPAQRKAVIARDGQCVWNGCETSAARCEVHHVLWWNRDKGPTDVEHAALTCRHHHGEIHRHDLSIQRLPHPPGTDPATPMRYVFRTPAGAVMNAPPGWTGPRVVARGSVAAPGTAARVGEGEPGGGLPAPDRTATGSTSASPVPDARRAAREQASFALFDSDGPPPAWATG